MAFDRHPLAPRGGHLSRPFSHDIIDREKNQIRLLTLEPKKSALGLIQCTVEVHDLETAPAYRAISYEWGPADCNRAIRVNSQLMFIRWNLWCFLDICRQDPEVTGYLWIDQICIDQTSVSERNHQVQLMSAIFSQATGVLAWLGPGKRCCTVSDYGSDTRERRHPNFELVFQDEPCSLATCVACPSWSAQSAAAQSSLHSWLCISGRSYWTRLWIIQELALARHVIYFIGPHKYSAESLQEHLYEAKRTNLWLVFASRNPIIYHVQTLLGSRSSVCRNLTLTQVISTFGATFVHCNDSRDLVYGLMGLVDPAQRLEADYGMNKGELYDMLLDRILCYSPRKISIDPGTMLGQKLIHLAAELAKDSRWAGLLKFEKSYSGPEHQLQGFFECLRALEQVGYNKAVFSASQTIFVLTWLKRKLEVEFWDDAGNLVDKPSSAHVLTCVASAAHKARDEESFCKPFEAHMHAMIRQKGLGPVPMQLIESQSPQLIQTPAGPEARTSIKTASEGPGLAAKEADLRYFKKQPTDRRRRKARNVLTEDDIRRWINQVSRSEAV